MEEYGLDLRLHLLFGTGNGGPCVAVTLPPLGVSVHLGSEVSFLGPFLVENGWVGQRLGATFVNLQAVLHKKDSASHEARLLRPLRGKSLRGFNAALDVLRDGRAPHIALDEQLGHGVVSLRGARIAGDKDQLTGRRAFGATLEIVVGVQWLAVVVDAEDGHIEVVARIGEVIRIAAEEGRLLFGRKDDAHIGVLLVLIEPVFAAVVERNHVGAPAGLLGAFVFDGGNFGFAGLKRLCLIGNAFGRALHARGNVCHADQHVYFEIGRLHLGIERGRIEAVAHIVVVGGGVLLQLAARHMVIGQQQAVGADERARSAVVEAHAGEADVVEPGLRGMEVVFGRQLLEGRVVKGPHAFFGVNHRSRSKQ